VGNAWGGFKVKTVERGIHAIIRTRTNSYGYYWEVTIYPDTVNPGIDTYSTDVFPAAVSKAIVLVNEYRKKVSE
jgi:hypothetical protein